MNGSKKLIFSFFISASVINTSVVMSNSVHAAGNLPNIQSTAYNNVGNIFSKSGYTGECTWFTYGRTLEKLGIALPSEFYGNAVDWWYANARDNIYSYGTEPRDNSIAVWYGGPKGYGHVGFVEKVEGNSVYLNEGNFNVRGSYDGNVKVMTKSQMQNRGNIFLKGYIYVGSGKSASIPASATTENLKVINSGIVSISSSGSSLNVRSGAGTSFGTIGNFKNGQSVQIVGTVGNWYKVKFNSSYGYVNSSYIKIGSSQQIAQGAGGNFDNTTSISQTKAYVKLSDVSSSLNLRSNPNGAVIGSLSNGQSLSLVGKSGNWCKVTTSTGQTGYVSSAYVSTTVPTNSVTVNSNTVGSPNISSTSAYVKLTDSSSILNLRSTPNGAIIGFLSNGTKISLLGKSGNWYKVSVNGKTGYISSAYVSTNTAAVKTSSPVNTVSGKTGTVKLQNSSSTLNLRNSAWTGRVVSSLKNGTKVTILSSTGRWYKVSVGSTIGYVHSDYIQL
ncbi:SH3 domain-containing protein [Clostridium tyrobutyricum]|uniref:SH3 domain-containing protein n=1 Tax=Clostridium tyrobutyricum TaxID=1519 RepID=UPI001C38158A|nr:SH3 domain-containing protein [Clostridium tyrobutyricum]MBV4425879.1 SH3 domain-containing protein [Clostridium tyrobutyricum]